MNILLPYAASSAVVEQHRDGFIASLRQELADRGWAVEDITLSVAPTAAASGKALDDSTADLAILPASQYFTYSDDVDLLMTATKPGVSVNSLNAADWNGSAEHPTYTDEDCPYSRTLICATNSETGRALAQSAKNGTLTWEELSAAKWMYAKASSSSDFFLPRSVAERTIRENPRRSAEPAGHGRLRRALFRSLCRRGGRDCDSRGPAHRLCRSLAARRR